MIPLNTFRHVVVRAIFALTLGISTLASAQDVQRIAAVVNDEIVSVFDLVERVKLVALSSGLEQSPEVLQQLGPQVLRGLIDERLRLQEAALNNVAVTDEELANAMRSLEERNKIPTNGLENFLTSQDIDPDTMITRLRAQIAWVKLLHQRQRRSLTISDDEVDAELDRLRASQGRQEYDIIEIFLLVESPDREAAVRQNARRIMEQIDAGADFAALARQFSEGATARQGGDVGWVLADQLAEEVAAKLVNLRPGQVLGPVRTGGGFLIVNLRDRRQRMIGNPDETQVQLKQIVLEMPEGAAEAEVAQQSATAVSLRATVSGCEDMARAATEIDPTVSGDLGMLRLKDLPPHFREVARNLPIGSISDPVRTKLGLHLLMVCDRIDAGPALPGREQIRDSLGEKRLDSLARQYLRDLRRSAFVEVRI